MSENAASQDLRGRLETLNREVEAARKNLADLSSQEARCRNIHQNAAVNRQNLQRRLKKIDEETVLAERKVADLTLQEQEARNGIQSVQQSIAAVEEQIAAQQEQATRNRQALALESGMFKNSIWNEISCVPGIRPLKKWTTTWNGSRTASKR